MTFQQSFDSLITKIQANFTWLKNNKADSTHTHSQYLTSHQDISGKQDTSNLVTAWGQTPSNSKYPSEKLVYDTIEATSGIIDSDFSMTSLYPVQNKVVTEAIADISANINLEAYLDMIISGTYADLPYTIQSSYNGDLDNVIDGTYTGV